jgi:hypothetical protein
VDTQEIWKIMQADTSKCQQPYSDRQKGSWRGRKPKELKNMIIKMISKMKEDMYKKINEFKEDTNSWMNKYNKDYIW